MFRLEYLQRIWPVVALLAFYVYLAFHALSGNQGLMRWVDYQQTIDRQTTELERLKIEREELEARADALRSDQLVVDALDLKARELIFASKPEELTIWLDQPR